jgi:hypothetical protein
LILLEYHGERMANVVRLSLFIFLLILSNSIHAIDFDKLTEENKKKMVDRVFVGDNLFASQN